MEVLETMGKTMKEVTTLNVDTVMAIKACDNYNHWYSLANLSLSPLHTPSYHVFIAIRSFITLASKMVYCVLAIPLAYLYCLRNPSKPYDHIPISDQSIRAEYRKQVKDKRKAMKREQKKARRSARLGVSVTSRVTSSPSPPLSSPAESLPSYKSREL